MTACPEVKATWASPMQPSHGPRRVIGSEQQSGSEHRTLRLEGLLAPSHLFNFAELPPEIADGAIWSVIMVPSPSQPAPSADNTARPLSSENGPTSSPVGLAELHRVHSGRLLRFFTRHGARQDAADLVQESFARLAGARAKKPDTAIERPEAYLSTIASNLLRDRARIAARCSTANHIPVDEMPLAGHDPIAALEARDQLERVQATLARLSPKTRSVFLAHRRDGISYKDIANREGLSEKAVERRMSKAMAHIKRARRVY